MAPAETLLAWRAEIASELEQLETHLQGALKERTAAETAYSAVASECADLQSVATRGVGTQGMAQPLYGRLLDARRDALRDVSRARGSARAHVKSLEEQIAGSRLALLQIDRATTADRVTPIRQIAKRPAPKAVEFDTIVPKEAV